MLRRCRCGGRAAGVAPGGVSCCSAAATGDSSSRRAAWRRACSLACPRTRLPHPGRGQLGPADARSESPPAGGQSHRSTPQPRLGRACSSWHPKSVAPGGCAHHSAGRWGEQVSVEAHQPISCRHAAARCVERCVAAPAPLAQCPVNNQSSGAGVGKRLQSAGSTG